jgi:radical SAM superfamily enzyme YgiQ (UPF0313 family)
MKILLIEPNTYSVIKKAFGVSGPPLGLAYLAAYVRGKNEVKIVDALSLDYNQEELKNEIKNFKPDIIGISAFATPASNKVYEDAMLGKSVNPNTIVVVGGAHATFTAKEMLNECKAIDVVVIGEGEETFKELVNTIKEGKNLKDVEGIVFRQGRKIIENPKRQMIKNLDKLPFPAYDLLPIEKYKVGKIRFATIITSRGCPFRCIFCSSSEIVGKIWRARSVKNIMQELKMLNKNYDVREIEFLDDLFTFDIKRTKDFCNALKKSKMNISWSCSSRADIIVRNPEIANYLKEAGCHTIYVGAESGSQKILNIIGKGITTEQVRECVKIVKRAGIKILLSFVIGIPGETHADIEKTIRFSREVKPDFVQFTICTPYPGTPLYYEAKKKGLLLSENWEDYNVMKPVMKLEHVSTDELKNY